MQTDKDIKRELEEQGLHILASNRKETGFKVPDGYFQDLGNSISNGISIEKPENESLANKFFTLRLVTSVAAGLLVLAIVAISLFFVDETRQEGLFTQFDEYEVEEYLASLSEFDRMLVTDYVLQLEVEGVNGNQEGFYEDDESLLDYLFDEINFQRFDPLDMLDNNQ